MGGGKGGERDGEKRREEEGVTEHMYDTGGERGERVERGRREESISVLSFFVVLDWKRVILISTTVEYTFEFYRLWPWKEGGSFVHCIYMYIHHMQGSH